MPGRSPNSSRRTPSEVWQAAYSNDGQLLDLVDHAQPVGGVDQQVGRVLDACRAGPVRRRSSSTRKAGASIAARSAYVFQPTTPTRLPGPIPSSAEDLGQRSRPIARLARQAEVLEEDPAHRQRRRAGHPVALVADEDRRLARPARRRGAPPRSAGRSRSGRPGWRCARGRRRRRAGRSRARRPARAEPVEAGRVERGRDLGPGVRHPEVGQVDRGEPRRWPSSGPSRQLRWRRPRTAPRWRPARCRRTGSRSTVQPRAHLAVGPLDADLGVARRSRARSGSSRAGRRRGRRRRSARGAASTSPTLTSIQAPIASRFGPGCASRSAEPVAHRRRLARRRRRPTFRQSLTGAP